jgi:alpha-L-rhamnosidase
MHRVIGGLAPDAPGYRHIRFAPRPGGGLTSASARQLTAYGEAAISWRIEGGRLHVELTVPVGAEAVRDLEGADAETLTHGTHTRSVPVSMGAAVPA